MRSLWLTACLLGTLLSTGFSQELLQNGDFEDQLTGWGTCWNFHCEIIPANETRFGSNSVRASQRTETWQGPSQQVHPIPGKFYRASSWVKILTDEPGVSGQTVQIEMSYAFPDGENSYFAIASRSGLTVNNGWVHLVGEFQAPTNPFDSASYYFQGPESGVEFAVDSASLLEISVDDYFKNGTDSGKSGDLIQNGGFEDELDNWGQCWGFQCDVISPDDDRFGTYSAKASHRTETYQGPSQIIHPVPGKFYKASSWVKLLNDKPGTIGQSVLLEVSFEFPDGQHSYFNVALKPLVTVKDGWVYLEGDFQAPSDPFNSGNFYYQGPDIEVDFAVDNASIVEISVTGEYKEDADAVIEKVRKSDLTVSVHADDNIDKSKVEIRVVETKRGFPLGTCVNSWRYVNESDPSNEKYRDFIYKHFNWAVLENALKWEQLEWNEGEYNYDRALKTIHGLRDHGLKVRGHNMVWSLDQYVPEWLKLKHGDELRAAVRQHIEWVLNITHGLLEHWDVNNENLHGHWFENALNDRDYNLELFRIMCEVDPYPKLFLNDYSVVGSGAATSAYRDQGQRFKDANVCLYGLGVQSHFSLGVDPNPILIKGRLDTLASVGVPLWVTELDASHSDENIRADYYEKALRALFGHAAVEGILFWGFWGDIQSGGQQSAWVTGPNLELTAAGRRILDLFENEWWTDETRVLSEAGDEFTVRAFHGDYEVRVIYQGQELSQLTKTVTLGKDPETVRVDVHV